jgi:hypothetical protein
MPLSWFARIACLALPDRTKQCTRIPQPTEHETAECGNEPFDHEAVTDEQRREAGVRALAESEQRLEVMNRREN